MTSIRAAIVAEPGLSTDPLTPAAARRPVAPLFAVARDDQPGLPASEPALRLQRVGKHYPLGRETLQVLR
jgi:hypothetical protein